MKRKFIFALLLCTLGTSSQASILSRIRFGAYPDKIRVVFDYDGPFAYKIMEQSKNRIVLSLKKTQVPPDIKNYVELNDLIVRYFEIEREGEDLVVTIPLNEPVGYQIFPLGAPPRLVIDFSREYLNLISGGTIADGVEYMEIRKGSPRGILSGNVIKIDTKKAEVMPALANKQKNSFFESFINLFSPWKTSKRRHFHLDKVSNIAAENDAIAGVNGTFFAGSGQPLGSLIINKETVSFPVYDRTALIFDEENYPHIDNVYITGWLKLKNGVALPINSLNKSRGRDEAVLYTPVWGEKTGSNLRGLEIVVSKAAILKISAGNSKIPEDGFVFSTSGSEIEAVRDTVKIGDRVETRVAVYPLSSPVKNILHLISGGPRLVKNGKSYISKYGEKFRSDIARGRAARTAAGITRQGELLLVVIDGPQRKSRQENKSIGATLEELSSLMLSLGAIDALNLDGGSSSTMVINNKVVNHPAAGSQRSVSNAIIVRPRP